MHKLTSFLAASAACLLATAASAQDKPDFPRLAGTNFGGPFNYSDPAYQAKLAKLHFSVLGIWPGFRPGGESFETSVRAIKARNPNTKVFVYVVTNELGDPAVLGTSWNTYRAKLDAMRWWLYPNGTSGSPVVSTYGPQYRIVNNTSLTAPDANGKRSLDYQIEYFNDQFIKPNPSLDGLFTDNVFWKPRVAGDWNRDGTSEAANSTQAATWLRQGYQRYYASAKNLMPGKIQLGNIADWGEPAAVFPELNGVVQGGLIESIIGFNWSVESWGGFNGMMAHYRKSMSMLAEPKMGMFNQKGDPSDYQGFRYGFGSCLLDDAYYSFSAINRGYSGVDWFDEYDVKLGKAISSPPRTAWRNGVYRRDFEKGIVLVNPKGNGQQTVTLESGFKRFQGTQAASVNNGQDATTITLRDRDAIVLVRKNAASAPAAPQLIAVQ